jgi:hypothetical protein
LADGKVLACALKRVVADPGSRMLKAPSSHCRVIPGLMARMLSKAVRRVEQKAAKF